MSAVLRPVVGVSFENGNAFMLLSCGHSALLDSDRKPVRRALCFACGAALARAKPPGSNRHWHIE